MNSDDLLRNQINQVIRSEIQSEINDYVDQQEAVKKTGLGFVDKEDKKELSQKELLEKMANIGVCPASYEWLSGKEGTCMNPTCGIHFLNGFQCAGGSHFICRGCVNRA